MFLPLSTSSFTVVATIVYVWRQIVGSSSQLHVKRWHDISNFKGRVSKDRSQFLVTLFQSLFQLEWYLKTTDSLWSHHTFNLGFILWELLWVFFFFSQLFLRLPCIFPICFPFQYGENLLPTFSDHGCPRILTWRHAHHYLMVTKIIQMCFTFV